MASVLGPSPEEEAVARRPRGLRDSLLVACWVFSYSALIGAFRILKRLESGRRPKKT
jgi:hypothetical protein